MLESLPTEIPPSLFPLAVLLSSLVGSWHCAGMCGPLACSSGLQGKSHLYHFGRMCSYTLLGLIAGGLGQNLVQSQLLPLRYTAAILMGLLLISLGVSFFFGWSWPEKIFSRFGKNWFKPIQPFLVRYQQQKFLLGFFTALLPCGWLYSFVLIAAATKSVWLGGMTMFIFWLGTVPALMLMSAGFRRIIIAPQPSVRKIFGFFFITAGLYSVATQIFLHLKT